MVALKRLCAAVCAAAVLAVTTQVASARIPASPSAEGRWFQAQPGWGCYEPPIPAAYQVRASIGPEVDALLGNAAAGSNRFTVAPLNVPFTHVGALYDPVHRLALFQEFGQDRGSYYLVANPGAPPTAVRQRSLSALAMGGKVHVGDTLANVRAALGLPSTFHLTTLASCVFPHAALYRGAIVYGPPHHPPLKNGACAY